MAEIDSAGTRSVVVRADPGSGLTTAILEQLAVVDSVDEAVGLGPVTDVRNAQFEGGTPVPVRMLYGDLDELIGGDGWVALPGTALASERAAAELGLVDGVGGIVAADGAGFTVSRPFDVPEHLRFLEPLVVVPTGQPAEAGSGDADPLAVLVVLADEPHHVAAVADVVFGLLAGIDPGSVTVETSQQLADIRAAISGELGAHGRATVLGILAISALLVAANLLGLVVMRRKDFGRRRALGATKGLIVGLLVTQVGLLSLIGAVLGSVGTVATLTGTGQPLPDLEFIAAVGVAGILTAGVAALLPATIAARRDPLHELRVP
jgi:putative ABC transport system permease protein